MRTDQRSLTHLWEQKITTTTQEKWLAKLMGYDFTIEYKKGKDNVIADKLSRREEDGEINTISTLVPHWLESIREEVRSNSTLQQLVKLCEQGEIVGPWKYQDGVLYFNN